MTTEKNLRAARKSHRGRLYCPDGRAEAGLATLAWGVLTVTGRDGFSGSAGVGTPPKPVAADTMDKR